MTETPFGIWCERPLPAEFAPLLGSAAVVIGAGGAGASPDFPAHADRVHAIIAGAVTKFDGAFMDRVPHLKLIARTGIGVDNVAIAEATARGIAVCNAPDVPTRATAEHAIALLLGVTKFLHGVDRALENGERRDFYSTHRAVEIEGLHLGIVGLGRIGRKVAGYGRGLGMIVIGHDPYLADVQMRDLGIEPAATLDDLLAAADVVSLHIPATADNYRLMNAARFAQMKRGAYLINTARGTLVDEAALLAALESGHLAGAGLDVFDPEPPSPENPLLRRPDVIATPHIGGITQTSRANFWKTALGQALQVANGERPVHLVNPEVWR